eukprot:scaffold950_cov360-Pavlova_lutheri.AAC.2
MVDCVVRSSPTVDRLLGSACEARMPPDRVLSPRCGCLYALGCVAKPLFESEALVCSLVDRFRVPFGHVGVAPISGPSMQNTPWDTSHEPGWDGTGERRDMQSETTG